MIDEETMIGFITDQRWFASKTREVIHAHVVDRVPLRDEEPPLELQLVEVGFETGTHDTYQLLSDDGIDSLEDAARHARELVHMMRSGSQLPGDEGIVEFATVEGSAAIGQELREARLVGTQQSNSSVVFDDQLILKVFRRLEAGVNPELEMLRVLTERGFENIAQLAGWYTYSGRPMDATLGILQRFVADGQDGWELMLDSVSSGADTLARIGRLGVVTAQMHSVLGADREDPAFCPEETSAEALGLLIARVDEEIEAMFFDLPDDDTVSEIRGRGEDLRERLSILASIGDVGRVIRTHGDFHLGQTLWSKGDWVLIDFEGEPARSLPERRRKRSPLRDVAGMLRSFAYIASALPMLRGVDAPESWEQDARDEFLAGYRAAIEPTLVPSGTAFDRLLSVFELEKAVYELRYELNNRPGWSHIPVAGIVRMLGEELPA
ncbi:MAG TPA: phosphotransferase [Gaiellaceae bacterium]|nr:phosphotransferase [Gaiellaceae bacterium]